MLIVGLLFTSSDAVPCGSGGGATGDSVSDSPKPESAAEVVAPVATIRASRSDCVVQVMLVPALFTNGKAAQLESTSLATLQNSLRRLLTSRHFHKIVGQTCH